MLTLEKYILLGLVMLLVPIAVVAVPVSQSDILECCKANFPAGGPARGHCIANSMKGRPPCGFDG
jgi:hypothetical protein